MASLFFFYSLIYFVFLSQSFSSSSVHHLCSPSEASASLQFKKPFEISNSYSCGTSSFPKTTFWNVSRDCYTWDGVTCDLLTGYVTGLDLSCSHLGGSIHPNNNLFQLHHLQRLTLADNDFNFSSIPTGIGHLRNLRHLNLSYSNFVGKIPTEISYLSNLVSLDLFFYAFHESQLDQGTFETLLQNFTYLEVVSFFSVNISSPIPMNVFFFKGTWIWKIPSCKVISQRAFFFILPNLERLKLGWNDLLKGVLPKLHTSTTLLELDISYIGISGELPDSIGTLSSLSHLNLNGCGFSGSIPDCIGNLTQLRDLYFSLNNFSDHIPSAISNLKQLTHLYLSSNSLRGKNPDVFSNLQELVELDCYINNFIGPFPSSILNLTRLELLDLSSNSLSGSLPSSASMLSKLDKLDLTDNSLNGTIPFWVFNVNSFVLMLYNNKFSGLA